MESDETRTRILVQDYLLVQRRIKDLIDEESVVAREMMENLICNGY